MDAGNEFWTVEQEVAERSVVSTEFQSPRWLPVFCTHHLLAGENKNAGFTTQKFDLGGEYRLCYAPDGDWNSTNTIIGMKLPKIAVTGIRSDHCFAPSQQNDFSNRYFRDGCLQAGMSYLCAPDKHVKCAGNAELLVWEDA